MQNTVIDTRITHEYIKANDISIELASCGEGDNLALLLHGFPESNYSWREQMPMLAQMGYSAWAPNLRGYGRSDKPKGTANYAIEILLQDIAEIIDVARQRGITGPVTLIGHDWGGALAWQFAIKQIRPLERLVVMNFPHPSVFTQALKGWQQLKKSWYVFFFLLPKIPEWGLTRNNAAAMVAAFRGMAVDKSRFSDEVIKHYQDNILFPGAATAMVNYYRAAILHRDKSPVKQNPPKLDTPTLMLWGENDTALGKELTYNTDRYVEKLTLRYLPEVSHWVQQEAPETVNAMLKAWLLDEPVPMA